MALRCAVTCRYGLGCGVGVGTPIGFTGPGQGVGSVGFRFGGTAALGADVLAGLGVATGTLDVLVGAVGLTGAGLAVVAFTVALGTTAEPFTGAGVGFVVAGGIATAVGLTVVAGFRAVAGFAVTAGDAVAAGVVAAAGLVLTGAAGITGFAGVVGFTAVGFTSVGLMAGRTGVSVFACFFAGARASFTCAASFGSLASVVASAVGS